MMEYSSKDGIFFAGREVHIVKILITYSMQKQGGKANSFYHINDVSVYLGM